jgi:hypothetical protein
MGVASPPACCPNGHVCVDVKCCGRLRLRCQREYEPISALEANIGEARTPEQTGLSLEDGSGRLPG